MPKTKAFKKLRRSLKKTYLGKEVPSEFVNRYGKKYDLRDLDKLSYAIAKSKKIKVDK